MPVCIRRTNMEAHMHPQLSSYEQCNVKLTPLIFKASTEVSRSPYKSSSAILVFFNYSTKQTQQAVLSRGKCRSGRLNRFYAISHAIYAFFVVVSGEGRHQPGSTRTPSEKYMAIFPFSIGGNTCGLPRALKGYVGHACLRDFYRWHLGLLVS